MRLDTNGDGFLSLEAGGLGGGGGGLGHLDTCGRSGATWCQHVRYHFLYVWSEPDSVMSFQAQEIKEGLQQQLEISDLEHVLQEAAELLVAAKNRKQRGMWRTSDDL